MKLIHRKPRPVQFSFVDEPCACSCCFQDVERAVRVELADAPGTEQRDSLENGPQMHGQFVEESESGVRGYVLVCSSCVSSMAAILSEWLVPT